MLKLVAVLEIVPVVLYNSPVGNGVAGLIAKLTGGVPDPACTDTGLNGVKPIFCVKTGIDPETTAIGRLGLTTRLN